jgi:dihydroorotate dehydrogenase (NAD+) catalytic subunit
MRNLTVNLAGVELKNPVTTASGTFGYGREYSRFIDINTLGAIGVKGISNGEWPGNPPPRIMETYGGMLNSIGLQNPGADYFIEKEIPFIRRFDTKIIANICGHTVEEYEAVAEKLNNADVDIIELNISCPNISEGGMAFGSNAQSAGSITKAVRDKLTNKPLIVKLSPNVTDIAEIARACEASGADAISLINTLLGMKIDVNKRKPSLPMKMAGLSGPAIKPVALRMVYQVAKAVKIDVLGMGGITTGTDAIEFMMAGAKAIAVGTANFANPNACADILKGIESFMEKENIEDINDIIGIIE